MVGLLDLAAIKTKIWMHTASFSSAVKDLNKLDRAKVLIFSTQFRQEIFNDSQYGLLFNKVINDPKKCSLDELIFTYNLLNEIKIKTKSGLELSIQNTRKASDIVGIDIKLPTIFFQNALCGIYGIELQLIAGFTKIFQPEISASCLKNLFYTSD